MSHHQNQYEAANKYFTNAVKFRDLRMTVKNQKDIHRDIMSL